MLSGACTSGVCCIGGIIAGNSNPCSTISRSFNCTNQKINLVTVRKYCDGISTSCVGSTASSSEIYQDCTDSNYYCTEGQTSSIAFDCSFCTAETNYAFCKRLNKKCGNVTANDNCGNSRTVASCGTCSAGYVCDSAGLCTTSCVDTCSSLSYNCGIQTICGVSTNCGTCSAGHTCDATGKCVVFSLSISIATLKDNYLFGEQILLTDPPEDNLKGGIIIPNNLEMTFQKDGFIYTSSDLIGNIDTNNIHSATITLGENEKTNYISSKLINSQNGDLLEREINAINGYIIEFETPPVLVKKVEIEKKAKENKEYIDEHSVTNPVSLYKRAFSILPDDVPKKLNYYSANLNKEHKELKSKISNSINRDKVSNRVTGNVVGEEDELIVLGEYKDVFNGVALNISEEEAKEIEGLDGVKKAYPNLEVKTNLMDSVPLIGADSLWQVVLDDNSLTGIGVSIAIIDTGIDYTHPDFGSCTSEQFLSGNCAKVVGGYDFINEDNNPIDDQGHGTHVAGIVAGNGLLKGVAPDANLYAFKVLDAGGSGSFADVIAGIERAIDPNQDGDFSDHVDIISMSLGASCGGYNEDCGPDDVVSRTIDLAVDAGIVSVIAAGNSGPSAQTIGSPGTARKAITVGATYKKDYDGNYWGDENPRANQITPFSSRGPVELENEIIVKPDIVAPGAIICSAQYDSAWNDKKCFDNNHVAISGTSMATPHVAGVVALIKQAHPDWNSQQIKDKIKNTAKDIGLDENIQGAGLINPIEAVQIERKALIEPYYKNIIISPITKEITKIESFKIKNMFSENLEFDIYTETNQPGITLSLSQNKIRVGNGEESNFDLIVKIDNDILSSNVFYLGYIVAVSGNYKLKIPVYTYIEDRLLSDKENINLGLDSPDISVWEKNFDIELTNVRIDSRQNYNVRLECDSYKYHDDWFNWFENRIDISRFFTLSDATLNFAPSEKKKLTIHASIPNNEIPNGIYSCKIILESDLNAIEIPFNFTKYYEFILDFDDNLGKDQLVWGYLQNNNKNLFLKLWEELPATFYLDNGGVYDLILFGYGGEEGTPVDFVKQGLEIAGSFKYIADFKDATNNLFLEIVDENGIPLEDRDGIITFENDKFGFWGAWYFDAPFGSKVRRFSNLPNNYFYRIIFTDLCANSDIHSISDKIYGLKEDFTIKNKPEDYNLVNIYYNSPIWKKIIPVHALQVGSLGQSCYNKENIIDSGSSIKAYIKDTEKLNGAFYQTQVLNSEEDPSLWLGHQSGHQSSQLEIVNGILRKSSFDYREGMTLEMTSDKNVYVGIGPDFWMGRFIVGEYSLLIQPKSPVWQWYFMTQGFDASEHEDMKYTLSSEDGSLIKEDWLFGGGFGYSRWADWINLPSPGKYVFNLERDYKVNNNIYYGKVNVVFDSSLEDKNPPYLDSMKVLCNKVPCETITRNTLNKITFIADPNGGVISSAKLFYSLNNDWIEVPISLLGYNYEGKLPALALGDTTFKIVVIDDSGNKLEYKFSLPVSGEISQRPQSKIVNDGGGDFSGNLQMNLQKRVGEGWIDEQIVVEQALTIPTNGIVKLDVGGDYGWNLQNVYAIKVGEYRVYASFETNENKIESTWEFKVS